MGSPAPGGDASLYPCTQSSGRSIIRRGKWGLLSLRRPSGVWSSSRPDGIAGCKSLLPQEELLSGPIRTPDEERRAHERARRRSELERELVRARREVEREITDGATFRDRIAPAPLNPLDRITAERRTPRLDVLRTEGEVARGGVRLAVRIVNAVFLTLYALLALRLVLAVVAPGSEAGFAQWITGTSDPLMTPFRSVFPSVTPEDGTTFALAVAFAMLVYALLHALIHSLLRVFGAPRGVL